LIRIDSIRIEGPANVLKDIDKTRFCTKQSFDSDGVILSDKLNIEGKNINRSGLNSIQFDNRKQTLTVALSSKILAENYYELININTIDQVFDTINKTGIVSIDKSKLDDFAIHMVDFTTNIKGSHKPNDYIQALQLMSLNSRYKVDLYKGKNDDKHKTGIVFTGRQSSFKERCIMYEKITEIVKDKNFISGLKSPLQVINQFSNVLRIENNVCQHRKIREYTNTQNTLISVLNSQAVLPNYKLFQKIKNLSGVQTDLFSFDPDMKLLQIEKIYGQQTIIKELCFDFGLIKDFISKHVKGNISGYVRQYRQIANDLLNSQNQVTGQNENDIIFELENLLKVA